MDDLLRIAFWMWGASVVGTGWIFIILRLNDGDWDKGVARWFLAAVVLGWMSPVLITTWFIAKAWRVAELPVPHLPKRLLGGVEETDGSLSVVDDGGENKR